MKLIILSLTLILLAGLSTVGQTTEFAYQGSLKDGANAANGNYDFEFLLFDALSGGAQVGATLTRSTVAVANGTFSLKLDFGGQFPGSNRFLEIHVRTAGGGAFTTLAPRQPVSSSPYAVQSLNATNATNAANATTATTATNATQLGGMAANQYVLTGDARLSDARTPIAGSSNYIQNGTALQTGSNFNISGNGTVGGNLSGNLVNSTSAFSIGGSNVFSNAGTQNLFAGVGAGPTNTGTNNAFFGFQAGFGNLSGSNNAFFGRFAGSINTTGNLNSFYGSQAGAQNSTGNNNSFFGRNAGFANTTNSFSAYFGTNAGGNADACCNSLFGNAAGNSTSTGQENSFFGNIAGNANITGNQNTAIGANADFGSSGLSNATAIGYRAMASQNNSLVLGSIIGVNGSVADTNVGIGTTAPTQKLEVNGNVLVSNQVTASQFNTGSARVFANSGFHNVYFGESSGAANAGTDNTLIGWKAGEANISNGNSFFGSQSGRATTSGSGNTFNGDRSGFGNTSGNLNSFFGVFAGVNNTTGSSNTFLGEGSGAANSTGSFNTIVGVDANLGLGPLTNATAIGAQARVDASNALVLGSVSGVNGATANTNVGIGTTSPGVTLDVRNDQSSAIFRLRSTAGSSSIFLDRASAVAANSAQIAFNSAGTADFAMGTSQGSAGVSDFSIYSYGTASNAFTIQKSTGRVGLGTASPGTALEIRRDGTPSSDWQTSQLRISGATDPNKQLNLGFDTTTNAGVIQSGQAFTGYKILYINPAGGGVSISGNAIIPPTGNMTVSGLTIGSGGLQVINLSGASGGSPLCGAGSAPFTVGFCSSSYRYKTNITKYQAGYDVVRRMNPIGYDWKLGGSRDIGLGAEDVEKIDKRLVFYNDKGQVEGVRYDRIGVVLINAVKEQQAQIEAQRDLIAEQDEVNKRQQAEIDALKKLVCSKRSRAAVCR